MKIDKYTIKATIPTGSYANVQPEITIDPEAVSRGPKGIAKDIGKANEIAMNHIKEMFGRFSEVPLSDREIEEMVEISATEQLKSFNENLYIDFDRVRHIYTYKGKELKSASWFVNQHSKEFDKQGVSATCAKAWGQDQNDILELWSSNGDIAASFGTALHAVLEHYFTHKDLGQKIFEASKKEENAALPKHPFLQKFIQELEAIDNAVEGEEITEVLVSNVEREYCGLVDKLEIIDRNKKICRVKDYKIVSEIEKKGDKLLPPFNEMSPNKLSKYQIQLSFYANLLELSGWKVDGLVIYAWDGEWKRYPLEVLKVIE